jgi:hypothetical protein
MKLFESLRIALIPPAPFSLRGRRGSRRKLIEMRFGAPLPLRERGRG